MAEKRYLGKTLEILIDEPDYEWQVIDAGVLKGFLNLWETSGTCQTVFCKIFEVAIIYRENFYKEK